MTADLQIHARICPRCGGKAAARPYATLHGNLTFLLCVRCGSFVSEEPWPYQVRRTLTFRSSTRTYTLWCDCPECRAERGEPMLATPP
jgi:hypothetical protein